MSFLKSINKEWSAGKDLGLFILRVAVAIALLYGHGFGKLSVIFGGKEIQFMDPIGIGANLSFYLAAFAEGICAILLVLGLFTRLAALVLTINFLVILYFHGVKVGDGFSDLEHIFLYFFAFLTILFAGAGKISLDYFLNKGKR
ncbi:MAG: DoxX family protein [Bacteroidetes bacterium]|nr:DoxX family protein [Bacteroidota bacterium]